MAIDRLRGEIAGRKFAPVYLLMGEEAFFIDALCDLLASTILQESERAFNQLTVYGRDSDAGQVVNLCRQMPMMGSYQVVILKEAQQLRGLDKLSLYTSKPSPTTILIVCHKEKNVDKRSQLYKSIAQHGAVLESVRPRDYEIGPWLAQFVASKGCTIDAKAQAMLTDHLGTDLARASTGAGKVCYRYRKEQKIATACRTEHGRTGSDFTLSACSSRHDEYRTGPAHRRPFRPQPKTSNAGNDSGPFQQFEVPSYLRWLSRHRGVPFPSDTELRHPANEQRLRSGRTEADLGTVGQPPGVPHPGAAAERRQIEGMNVGGAPDGGEMLRELLLKIFLQ